MVKAKGKKAVTAVKKARPPPKKKVQKPKKAAAKKAKPAPKRTPAKAKSKGKGKTQGAEEEQRIRVGVEAAVRPSEALAKKGGAKKQKKEDPKVEGLMEFVVQTLGGMVIAPRRAGFADAPYFGALVRTMLAEYLNMCWMSLLKDDDEYVRETFASIAHRSPYCVLQKVYELGEALLPLAPLEISIVGEDGADVPRITRQIQRDAETPAIYAMMEEMVRKLVDEEGGLEDNCKGPALNDLRAQWKKDGSHEERFFVEADESDDDDDDD